MTTVYKRDSQFNPPDYLYLIKSRFSELEADYFKSSLKQNIKIKNGAQSLNLKLFRRLSKP